MGEAQGAALMLSVSGARGIVGRTMTPDVAWRLAASFGMELKQRTGKPSPVVVIARDSRVSGEMVGAAAVAGLMAVGCRVVRMGIAMTPTAGVMVLERAADGGMVATASHNPIEWNGLKCLNADGAALSAADAGRVIERFQSSDFALVDSLSVHRMESDEAGLDRHLERVLATVETEPIRRAGLKAVVDSVNGAGGPGARRLLEALGVEVVAINGEPSGHFAHTPEPVRENLTGLCEAVREHGADVGFAQDPDADRLAIVDERGHYIGEEYTLALCTEYALGALGDGARGRVVAANLSTSRMIDDVAAAHGARVVRSAVGEANVVSAMQAGDAVIGGEGNGGVIWPKVCWIRDSLSGMALVLSLIAKRGRRVSELVAAIPSYAIEKGKVPVKPGLAEAAIAALEARYRGTGARIDRQDGIRIDFEDRGAWVQVRASNTEPIVRVISEARSAEAARRLQAEAREVIDTTG